MSASSGVRRAGPRAPASRGRGPISRLLSALALTAAATLGVSRVHPQDVEAGKTIFLAKCAKCHGKSGVPRRIAKGAPNFTDPKWTITLEQIERSVIDGKGEDMPKFKSKLGLEQIKIVSAFVQNIKYGALAPSIDVERDAVKE